MTKAPSKEIDCRRIELDGVRYVIIRESVFERLCNKAGVRTLDGQSAESRPDATLDIAGASLAEKLVRRRVAARLSQAELARRAGVRPETLNRIERGHTTPDFATIRKLVEAINAAEQDLANQLIP